MVAVASNWAQGETAMKYGPSAWVRWEDLSDEARQRLLSQGHPSNYPTARHIKSGQPIFRIDGNGYKALTITFESVNA